MTQNDLKEEVHKLKNFAPPSVHNSNRSADEFSKFSCCATRDVLQAPSTSHEYNIIKTLTSDSLYDVISTAMAEHILLSNYQANRLHLSHFIR